MTVTRFRAVLFCIALWAPCFGQALEIREIRAGANAGGVIYASYDNTTPVVSVHLLFPDTGYVYEHEAYIGVSAMAASILEEGGGTLSPAGFRALTEKLHAGFGVSAGSEAVTVSITALKPFLPYAAEAVIDLLAAPSYADADIDLYRKRKLTALREMRDKPSYIAGMKLTETIFGESSPYARPSIGNEESLGAINADILSAYHYSAFDPAKMRIAVAGDMTDEEISALFSGLLTRMRANRMDPPEKIRPQAVLSGKTPAPAFKIKEFTHVHVEKDLPQTYIAFAMPAVTRTHPDFFDYYVADYLLGGGGFESVLMEEIREKQGLAYSIGTGLSYNRQGAVLRGSAGVSPENAEKAIAGVKEQLEKLASPDALGEERVAEAKSYLLRTFLLSMYKNSNVSGMLSSLQHFGFGDDYLELRAAQIAETGVRDIAQIFAGAWNPSHFAAVTVGKTPPKADGGTAAQPATVTEE